MEKTKTNKIEEALLMYKETVSPLEDTLLSILNQIPEKENLEWRKQAIRSPYIWSLRYATSGIAALFIVAFAMFPSLEERYIHRNDPFYAIDKQVERFEEGINDADYNDMLLNYNKFGIL